MKCLRHGKPFGGLMNRLAKSVLIVSLTVATAGNAFADNRRFRHNDSWRHHDRDWIAPLVFLGIAGAIIGASAAERERPAPPVYVEPPMPAPSESRFWYYCPSSRQYYPYAQYCPEPWMQVPSTPH